MNRKQKCLHFEISQSFRKKTEFIVFECEHFIKCVYGDSWLFHLGGHFPIITYFYQWSFMVDKIIEVKQSSK